MILITSAAYVNPSLVSELSKLPPCMLPVQNKRLYMHQISLFEGRGEKIFISLPASYDLPIYDKRILKEYGVNTIFVPDSLNLGQSVVYCINSAGLYNEPLYILHGDTLFDAINLTPDSYSVARAEDNYTWASIDNQDQFVYAGFFAFSSPSLLIKKIIDCTNNFIGGLEAYMADKPMKRFVCNDWKDFGIVNTYYRSISQMTTQRAFNSLKGNRYSIRKSSKDITKMGAEANWIQSLPKELKHYAPALWDYGVEGDRGYYEIEYYYLSSLANLYVFTHHPLFVWNEIMESCLSFLDDISKFRPSDDSLLNSIANQNNSLYLPKTLVRLEQYSKQSGMSIDAPMVINGTSVPSLRDIAIETGTLIAADKREFVTLMHGDFCFSNILYDFRSKTIKVLDPRGIDLNGNMMIFGDIRYDVAKLAHSILGLYDFIIGGMFTVNADGEYDLSLEISVPPQVLSLQESFKNHKIGNYDIDELSVYPIMVHLFLSMLPLHNDNPERQKAMLANALRLYVELKERYK